MGSSQSVEIPGGGTEGYHVLRVSEKSPEICDKRFYDTSSFLQYFLKIIIRFKMDRRVRKLDLRHSLTLLLR